MHSLTQFAKPISFPKSQKTPTYIRTKPVITRACIPSTTKPIKTLYTILGISCNVSLGEIKKAYKEMALKYHPDLSPPGRVHEYTEKFIIVKEAYDTLSDPNKRALYDNTGFSFLQYNANQEMEEDKSEWKNRWRSQLSELKRRSVHKKAKVNMSWGEMMRREKADSDEMRR